MLLIWHTPWQMECKPVLRQEIYASAYPFSTKAMLPNYGVTHVTDYGNQYEQNDTLRSMSLENAWKGSKCCKGKLGEDRQVEPSKVKSSNQAKDAQEQRN
ncbi:hypothetical protein Tco_0266622 [Tanacetum coccineum]